MKPVTTLGFTNCVLLLYHNILTHQCRIPLVTIAYTFCMRIIIVMYHCMLCVTLLELFE